MTFSAAEALGAAVSTLVGELAASGVRHVCACPGSRSTPLAIELARQPRIKLWMHLDERSAAYFALGLARTLREPVGLLATSGTAAANFFPAVAESWLARVPLVVLTADRPHELRDNGAAQTIDQLALYGHHVKWFFDLPEPDAAVLSTQLPHLAALAARAVSTASAEPPGPVHLNWPFREPLVPVRAPIEAPAHVRVSNPRLAPSPELVQELAASLRRTPRGLFVVGPQDDPELAGPLTRLAGQLGYPILADGLADVRFGSHDRSHVIDRFDAFLRDAAISRPLAPQVVVRIGAIPTSRPLLQFLERQQRARHVVVDPGGWRDPSSQAADLLHVDPRLLCVALLEALDVDFGARSERDADWVSSWQSTDAAARRAIDTCFATDAELSEGKLFAMLGELLPDGALIYAGNSMPVRDLDSFLGQSETRLRCLSNRGANGIDGVVSSALGASAAGTGPVVLVIGDVSFYHDLNGLLAASKHGLDLLVILVNNDGGGIFSFLPQADTDSIEEKFELLFGTPHGLSFRPFVEGYGGRFARIDDWPGFTSAVADGLARGGLQVVEVPTDRRRNVVQHRAVWRTVAEALKPVAVV